MYKLLLILKYLRKRRIAWVSLVAVMLCTTMVLVVISVMGGWLRMFRQSFHGLSGDIMITSRTLSGFDHYQEMIDRIEKLPGVDAAAPVIRTFGLMRINGTSPDAVQVMGYPIDQIVKINGFKESLHRQYEVLKDKGVKPQQIPDPTFNLIPDVPYEQILPSNRGKSVRTWPGMIVGAGVVGIGKNKKGEVERPLGLYDAWVQLEVLGMKEDAGPIRNVTPTPHNYWIVDDSRTQIWQFDSKTVYVPFDVLQKDLDMNARAGTDPDTNENFNDPARTTDVYIKAKPGQDLYQLKPQIVKIVADYYPSVKSSLSPAVAVETWEESNATWLDAIENEKSLVTILFGIISIVAIFLIFCIFYMIVVEKTRDIGIIKSVGATSSGVAGIFLGYGLAIGIVGSGLGFALGYFIVHNINYLHGEFTKLTGKPIWNPEVYAFDTIPNRMNPHEVIVILAIAVLASVLGALVPAIRAARMHPVESLRWE
jgi:lipoprotein-releasing system permease protein